MFTPQHASACTKSCLGEIWTSFWNEYFTLLCWHIENMCRMFESVLNLAASCARRCPSKHARLASRSNSVPLPLPPVTIAAPCLSLLSPSPCLRCPLMHAHLHHSTSSAEMKRAALLRYQAICPQPINCYYCYQGRRDRGRGCPSHFSDLIGSCGSYRRKVHWEC